MAPAPTEHTPSGHILLSFPFFFLPPPSGVPSPLRKPLRSAACKRRRPDGLLCKVSFYFGKQRVVEAQTKQQRRFEMSLSFINHVLNLSSPGEGPGTLRSTCDGLPPPWPRQQFVIVVCRDRRHKHPAAAAAAAAGQTVSQRGPGTSNHD